VRLPATYPLWYASVAPLPAALLDGLFEQPAGKPSGPKETLVKLVLPQFVAIDSSTLASWAKDAFALDSKLRASACDVQTSLLDANWIPIICLTHFMELARHSDLEIATKRIDFLKSFSQIAWFGRSYGSNILGAIVDIFETEVAAIVASPDIDFLGIRRSVREKLVQYGPPTNIEVLNDWEYLRPALKAMATHEQEIASIVHGKHSIHDDTKIARLKKIRPIDRTAINRPASTEVEKLAIGLMDRGDRRLVDPYRTAQDFLKMVSSHLIDALNLQGTAYDVFVASHDVPKSDISDHTTLRQFAQIARHRKLARVACNQLGIDLDQVWPKLRNAKIPSEIVQEKIRMARKTARRASGSDIGDDYLACLAPYVDAIIVDKRTHEFMTQGAQRDPYFRKMVGFFEKAASYRQLPEILARHSGGGQPK
jgi:hypothetical protein